MPSFCLQAEPLSVPSLPPRMQRIILTVRAPSYDDDGKSWNESLKDRSHESKFLLVLFNNTQ